MPALLFNLLAQHHPGNPALLSPSKKSISYEQLAEQLRAAALRLNQFGLRRNDRVAVVLPNGPEMAVAYLAVSAVCTCAPLNPAYSADEMEFYLTDLSARALVLPAGQASPARIVATRLGIPLIELDADPQRSGLFALASSLPLDETIPEPVLAELDDVALVLHTSGTTSRPKIVPLTHRNLYYSIHNIAQTYNLAESDRCLSMMPLFHIHGLMGALSATLLSGGSIICAPGLKPDQVLGWLSELAPTWYTAVPTMHQAILEQTRSQPALASKAKLRFIRSSSSALPSAVAEGLEKAFHAPVLEAYGMTEATHQMASNPLPPRVRKFGSVGLPTGTTKIVILDDNGTIQPANTLGEISICGENVMVGYEKNPQANASAFTNDWLRTGDRGYLDADGYLFIQGRLKEIINRGGEKISPREIDDALLQHPAVAQAVVFATPHPTLGEDVAAAVVLRKGQALTARELRQFAGLKLAEFKIPRQVVFLDEIPKGSTGKIQRIGLAEKLAAQLEAARTEGSGGAGIAGAGLTALEQELLEMWKTSLGQDSITADDDFLALGGDSLRAVQLISKINEHFGSSLTMRDIFDTPTVRDVAALIKT